MERRETKSFPGVDDDGNDNGDGNGDDEDDDDGNDDDGNGDDVLFRPRCHQARRTR